MRGSAHASVRVRRACLVALVLAALAAGCAPEATPLPAFIPTVTPAAASSGTSAPAASSAPLRIAVLAHSAAYVPDRLGQAGAITAVDAPPDAALMGAVYDLALGYGVYNGWSESETPPVVALALDATRLDDVQGEAVLAALDAQAAVAAAGIPGVTALGADAQPADVVRTRLANAGLPDGFNLSAAVMPAPGVEALSAQWSAANVTVFAQTSATADTAQAALEAGTADAALLVVTEAERAQFAGYTLVDLYRLPISYLAAPGVRVTTGADGFPDAVR